MPYLSQDQQNTAAASDKSVQERLAIIRDGLDANPSLQEKLPGLKSILDEYLDPDNKFGTDTHRHGFHRRLLQVFRDSEVDDAYGHRLSELRPDEQDRIKRFVAGSPVEKAGKEFAFGPSLGVREHIEKLVTSKPVYVEGLNSKEDVEVTGLLSRLLSLLPNWLPHGLISSPRRSPKNPDPVMVYENAPFQNWGLLVEYTPTYTCIPSTIGGIQRIVKFAKKHNMGVRCAGFRHSWSPIFGRNGNITISLLGLYEVTQIPNFLAINKVFPQTEPTELETIKVVTDMKPRVEGNALVRVGVSCTNERLRRWCIETSKKWTYPLNVIMVEMTVGGTNAPICHGAGRAQPTLSDLVRKIEYVDCHGEVHAVDDPAQLRAAAGCFGLMGVITHITLEFEPMSYALLNPQKLPVMRAVPPPDDILPLVPAALRVSVSSEERAADIASFEAHCNDDYYVEYFWFPYADRCWVNNWNNTTDATGVLDYPSDGEVFFMFVSQFLMNVLQHSKVLEELMETTQVNTAVLTLMSCVAMLVMPSWDKPVKTWLPDALHFQRAIQNVRVLDMEVEMPLLPKKDDATKPDYDHVRRAWWDAILTCYKHSETCPQRMPLEMRIMGGSDIIMAPQRGNSLGTCSIEVLTLESAGKLWKPYAEDVLQKWMSYQGAKGEPLRTRPHWAKQWKDFDLDGKPWAEKMKKDYEEDISEFKTVLAGIGRAHGWTMADLKERFSNDVLDDFYFDDVKV